MTSLLPGGGARETRGSMSAFIKGSPDIGRAITLYIGPQAGDTKEMTLFLAGPPAAQMPLVIGIDTFASGDITLFAQGKQGFVPDGGGSDNEPTTLYIQGTANSGVSVTANTTLVIQGPDFEYDTNETTLFINAAAIPVNSGQLTLFTEGGSATSSNPELDETQTTLFIRNADAFNDNTTLHLETDFNLGQTTPLFIKSNSPSGVMPLNVEGANIETEQITLLIKPPTTNEITLFNRGYRE